MDDHVFLINKTDTRTPFGAASNLGRTVLAKPIEVRSRQGVYEKIMLARRLVSLSRLPER